jgi:hypothetical protein
MKHKLRVDIEEKTGFIDFFEWELNGRRDEYRLDVVWEVHVWHLAVELRVDIRLSPSSGVWTVPAAELDLDFSPQFIQ